MVSIEGLYQSSLNQTIKVWRTITSTVINEGTADERRALDVKEVHQTDGTAKTQIVDNTDTPLALAKENGGNLATIAGAITSNVMQTAINNNLTIVDNFEPVVLQNVAITTGLGTLLTIGDYKTLVIEISGTSTSKTVLFQACGQSGVMQSIQGIHKLTFADGVIASQSATDTHVTPEIWEFDVAGLYQFQTKLSAIANGNCTIEGTLV